jgi:hypothetical protein
MLNFRRLGRPSRIQSAMEYLMTYGWAILVIALVVVALFSVGTFSLGAGVNGCDAVSGFLCQKILLSSSVNNQWSEPSITVNIGTTIAGWTNVYIVAVPQGVPITQTNLANEGSPTDILYWGQLFGEYNAIQGNMQPYQTIPVTVYINPTYPPVGGTQIKVGSSISGTLWAMYSTSSVTNALAPIANFKIVATS